MNGYIKDATKIIFYVLGSIFLILGIIGVLLPIIPGIPFLIISVLFFAAGMTRRKRKEFKKKINREVKKEVGKVEKVVGLK